MYSIQAGTVIAAVKSGYNSGAGKYVKIDFGNGYVATYMHLAKVNVNKGEDKFVYLWLVNAFLKTF